MLSRNAFTAKIETVLFETDAPDLVLARDPFDTYYLCSLVEIERDNHFYLAIPITSERLSELRTGRIDLRTALTDPESSPYFTARLSHEAPVPTLAFTAVLTDIPEKWLPGRGFLLSNFGMVSNETVVTEAVRRQSTYVECRLSPPEASGTTPKINAGRLAEWLNLIQSLVSHAARRAHTETSKSYKENFGPDPYVMQVVGFSGGSFTVHLASPSGADLFGSTPMAAGMQLVDKLVSLIGVHPDDAVKALADNSGTVLQAFESLMNFVVEEQTPLEYRWADPSMGVGQGKKVTPAGASSMAAILRSTTPLKTDTLSFEGQFTAVNTTQEIHTWQALDAKTQKGRHGRVHEATRNLLSGVTIRDTRYRFDCEVRLEKPIAGKSKSIIFLKNLKEL